MPLPISNKDTAWPPRDLKPYIDQARTAQAWYLGNHFDLEAESASAQSDGRRRRFWQRRKTSDATKATARLHAPLSADIASVSADLLFGDEIALTVDDKQAQAQIELLEDELGLANLFLEGAETASATGGCYLRCAWDEKLAAHGLLQTYDQMHAIPDFRYRRLWAVSLWEDVHVDGSDVWRHIERHERGRILHGLYKGTKTTLGVAAPLQDHPTTEGLPPEITFTGVMKDRLMVSYAPNVLPNLLTPSRPIGRPDISGSEDLADALDEAWTSLMRDVRLGQAHVFVPQEWLQAAGGQPGKTKTLDMDTEIFTALNIADAEKQQKMETYQADIRVQDHLDLALALSEQIISRAGYSPQTFGLKIEGRAESGTALNVRKEKTNRTRQKKRRYWEPALRDATENLLAIGREIFNRPGLGDGERVTVGWPENDVDPVEQATWINSLRMARAMSIETAVKLAQPGLDEKAAAEEVERIKAEDQVSVPFPEA